jgi:hypothetical protein
MAVIPSPLSSSIQGINQTTVSGNIFGGGNKVDAQTQSSIDSNTSAVASLQKQVNQLSQNNAQILTSLTQIGSFQAQVDSVRLQLNGISDTLQSVATITTNENVLERQKDNYEQEKQKRLAEAGARGGQEGLLETKIQSALSEPVKRIGNKVSFGFNNLMSFVMTLLGGWLTTQGINVLKALQDGNKKKLNEIKDSVIKTLLIAGGVFTIINVGIGKVIGTITGLASKIAKFLVGGLIIKPFQAVMRGLGGALPGRTVTPPTGPKPGPKGPVKGPNFLGGALNLYTALRNYGNGEITDTIMQGVLGALLLTPAGRLVSAVRTILGVAVTADEIAEVFGSNIFGENPDILKKAKQVKDNAEKEAQKNKKNKLTSSPLKKDEPLKPETAKPAPTTSMTPPASNLQINAPETQKTPDTQKAPETKKAPDPAKIKQFEQAWQYKDNPLARGRIEGAWNKMSSEEKQQAKDWAESTNKDWKEMKLPDPVNQISPVPSKETPKSAETSSKPSTPPTTTAAETSSKPSTPEITPAQTTKMQTVPFNIGPEPEPKPNVVYAPSKYSSTQQKQPMSTGAASDVPNIPSSNPDNFYTLYSQINYNVVL